MTSVVVVDGGGAVLEYVSDAEVVSQVRVRLHTHTCVVTYGHNCHIEYSHSLVMLIAVTLKSRIVCAKDISLVLA